MTVRTGPKTTDTTTIALGLAQIRVGDSAMYIGQKAAILPESASIGALANTKFTGNREFYSLESGFPMLEDAIYPLREKAAMELSFKQVTPANIALSRGNLASDYPNAHTGEINLGDISSPSFIRMEAIYTYPDGVNTMKIIFPRAQVTSSTELDFGLEEPSAVPIVVESKRADVSIAGGHTIWDNGPLGVIVWGDGTGTTTTTSSSSTTTTTSV